VFDLVCVCNVVWSPTEQYDLWYVLATLGCCSLQSLLVHYGSFHVRWSSKMGIFHLTLTKIHEIS